VSGFAAFALMLASLGIYAVMSYSVGQRQQEIGLRMALGASPRELQRGVLMQAGRLALVGLGLGVPAAWMVARAMQGMLFEVAATDRLSFGIVVGVLAGVTLLAGYLPARRASRVDPSLALRA
jgi:ABC-type antimicrobial peptide transport system permease subunit